MKDLEIYLDMTMPRPEQHLLPVYMSKYHWLQVVLELEGQAAELREVGFDAHAKRIGDILELIYSQIGSEEIAVKFGGEN